MKATIKLTNGIEDSKSNIGLYRAFIQKKGSTGAEIKVKLDLKKHKKELETRLESMSNIQLVKTDYNFLVKEVDGGKVIIYVGLDENMPLKNMKPMTVKGTEQYDSLVLFLKQASQIEMLRKLNCSDANIDFDVKFLNGNGNEVFSGLEYIIEVTNTGNDQFSMQIIEIEPNSKINVLPAPSFNFTLLPNGKRNIKLKFSADPPGMEQLLLIATPSKIDLSPLGELGKEISTRGSSSSPLVEFINTNSSGTRGLSSDPGEVTVKPLIFEIKPKQ
jgi:hypothetical protein